MKTRKFSLLIVFSLVSLALGLLFWFVGGTRAAVYEKDLPGFREALREKRVSRNLEGLTSSPTITDVQPASAPNDIDTPIVIRGTGFTATLSGTQVITAPTVYLGDDALPNVIWGNTTTLSATVPWGMVPEVYTLTVVNPDGISATLPNVFTVTEGIGIWTTGGPYGGQISQIRVHPDIPTTIYANADDVGVFVSYDAAATWEPFYITDAGPPGFEFDAQNRDIIYVGNRDRTLDGGESWESLTIHTPIPYKGWDYKLTADPVKDGRLYAAASTPHAGITGSVLRSDNYGEYGSWITLTESITDKQFTAVAVHPTNNATLLVGTQNGNLYYSLNSGDTWHWAEKLTNGVSQIYFNPYEPLEAWLAQDNDANGAYLHKSTNLTDWTQVNVDLASEFGNVRSLIFLTDTLWVTAWNVYTSTDSGANWSQVEARGSLSLDVHPAQPQSVYAGDFTNGVFKSSDGGLTWQESSEGLAGVFPSAILVAPDDPQTVYVKINPGLFKSENGGQSWRDLNFGGGGFPTRTKLAIDPHQPQRLYFGHGCPNSTCLWISDNGGENWISVTASLPVTYTGWGGAFWTLAVNPHVPGQVFAGIDVGPQVDFWEHIEGLFYVSNNYGLSWTHVGPSQPISRVSEIVFDAQNPDLIYIGTQGTGLWKSTDGGQNWAKTPSPGGLEYVDTLVTHPEIGGMIFVTFYDQFGGPQCGLYVSEDAGQTWTFLAGDVGGQLLFAPTYPLTLYSTGGGQLARSTDNGQTWQRMVGAPRSLSLATGTDGERVVLYVGSPGGLASQAGVQTTPTPNAVLGDVTIFGGGVYRLTMLLPTDWLYLPLIVK